MTSKAMPPGGIIKVKRVFKVRHFARWMRKTALTDAALCEAVQEMSQGLIDADLGGARTLVATNKNNRWFFVFGFEKNERANIDADELEALQELAAQLLGRTDNELEIALADGALKEICHEHQNQN